MYCFWYSSKNEPRIVVGPDWYFSVFEMILVNGISSTVMYPAFNADIRLFLVGLAILLF